MSSNVIRVYEGDSLAVDYVKYRPSYPSFILEKILKYIGKKLSDPGGKKCGSMIDIGCGSGQATHMFTEYFEKILGIDISTSQIDVANSSNKSENVSFQLVYDNFFPILDASCDLVNCATAAHWLDLQVFESECNRVLRPGGAVAIYTYLLLGLKPLQTFGDSALGQEGIQPRFFDAILKFINNSKGHEKSKLKGYQEIFEEIKNPSKEWVQCQDIDKEYTLVEFKGFMSTLGEYPTYMADNPSVDPMDNLILSIKELLKVEDKEEKDVKFLITLGHQMIFFKKQP